jgi:hypothetical protein
VAENISLDRETNEISAFTIMEGVAAAQFPVFLRRLTFLAVIDVEDGDAREFPARFTLTLHGKDLVTQDLRISFLDQKRARCIVRLQGAVVPEPGVLTFRLTTGTAVLAEYGVDFELLTPDQILAMAVPAAPVVIPGNRAPDANPRAV